MKPRISFTTCHAGPRTDADTKRIMRAESSRMAQIILDGEVNWKFSWAAKRNSYALGEPDGVPYLLDQLAHPPGTAIIMFTNADIGFSNGIFDAVRTLALNHGAVHMRRIEVEHSPIVLNPDRDELSKMGTEYIGMDGCAFTVGWWRMYGGSVPDLLVGRYGWDCVLRNLIRRHGGVELKHALWHEKHDSPWLNNGDWKSVIGNVYNKRLVDEWIEKHGGSYQDHLLSDAELKETFK